MKKKIPMIIIILIVFLLDQVIKIIVNKNISYLEIIPSFLSLTYAKNKGVAFSMFWGNRIFIIFISIIIIYFLIKLIKDDLKKNTNINLKNCVYGLLFGGILGNLFDRLLRGYVIDYVSLNILGYNFPIFNLADVAITMGVILMIILIFKEEKIKDKVSGVK